MNANNYVFTDDVLAIEKQRLAIDEKRLQVEESGLEVEKARYALEERRVAMLECYLQRLTAAGEQETTMLNCQQPSQYT